MELHIQQDANSQYTVEELERICLGRGGLRLFPSKSYNEVYPNIFISDKYFAENTQRLAEVGITHVINLAEMYTKNCRQFYENTGVEYYGVDCDDSENFQIGTLFDSITQYMHTALEKHNSKILVHCIEGYSRSPTIVIAYIMLYKDMDVKCALLRVKQFREIGPNRGFLQQLCLLHDEIRERKLRNN